ncbi:MAG: hypothetical protein WBN31_07960 [Gammaproteobacteria bacterium]
MPDTITDARAGAKLSATADANRVAAPKSRSVWQRLGWFALLWCASLGVWLLIAYGLRGLLALD